MTDPERCHQIVGRDKIIAQTAVRMGRTVLFRRMLSRAAVAVDAAMVMATRLRHHVNDDEEECRGRRRRGGDDDSSFADGRPPLLSSSRGGAATRVPCAGVAESKAAEPPSRQEEACRPLNYHVVGRLAQHQLSLSQPQEYIAVLRTDEGATTRVPGKWLPPRPGSSSSWHLRRGASAAAAPSGPPLIAVTSCPIAEALTVTAAVSSSSATERVAKGPSQPLRRSPSPMGFDSSTADNSHSAITVADDPSNCIDDVSDAENNASTLGLDTRSVSNAALDAVDAKVRAVVSAVNVGPFPTYWTAVDQDATITDRRIPVLQRPSTGGGGGKRTGATGSHNTNSSVVHMRHLPTDRREFILFLAAAAHDPILQARRDLAPVSQQWIDLVDKAARCDGGGASALRRRQRVSSASTRTPVVAACGAAEEGSGDGAPSPSAVATKTSARRGDRFGETVTNAMKTFSTAANVSVMKELLATANGRSLSGGREGSPWSEATAVLEGSSVSGATDGGKPLRQRPNSGHLSVDKTTRHRHLPSGRPMVQVADRRGSPQAAVKSPETASASFGSESKFSHFVRQVREAAASSSGQGGEGSAMGIAVSLLQSRTTMTQTSLRTAAV